MRVLRYTVDVVREPLARPFSFKGGSFTEKWLTVTTLESEGGTQAAAVGGLAVLWSDPQVFWSRSEAGGNILMCAVAEHAAALVAGLSSTGLRRPDEILAEILPAAHEYARAVTGLPGVRRTFTLNALVSLDLALWKLYAWEKGAESFEDMLPRDFALALGWRHARIAHIPLVSYGIPVEEVRAMAEAGAFLWKVKIGQAGSEAEMLRKDCDRLTCIHREIGGRDSPGSPTGRVLYYLDANGRYTSKSALLRLLEHAQSIGMLGQIILLEEPFSEAAQTDVSELPVRVAADESLETVEDVRQRISAGYGAVALKPAGKTLSASLAMARAAHQQGVPCFVADSACVPVLVDWNKNVAARLAPLPEIGMGALESNGAEHYRRWAQLLSEHPCAGADWLVPRNGTFRLDDDFYARSGCVLL